MKAIVYEEFGGPDVLHLADVPEPVPGPGQVRVRVRAASVNPFDHKVRTGAMEAVFHTALPATPGLDLAGVVDAVGAEVTEFAVGDEVLGWADTGGYAEYALADPAKLVAKPAELSWVTAAALPSVGETALRVLRLLNVAAGETLLVHGASGAVGSLAVQLAVASGITVLGTASAANQDYVRSLGATPIEYGDDLVARVRAVAPQGVAAVFDTAGKGALPASIELRGGKDRIITIADPAAFQLGVTFSSGGQPVLAELADLVARVADGSVTSTIAATYPLADAAAAQRDSEAGRSRGKLVLTID